MKNAPTYIIIFAGGLSPCLYAHPGHSLDVNHVHEQLEQSVHSSEEDLGLHLTGYAPTLSVDLMQAILDQSYLMPTVPYVAVPDHKAYMDLMPSQKSYMGPHISNYNVPLFKNMGHRESKKSSLEHMVDHGYTPSYKPMDLKYKNQVQHPTLYK